VSAVVGANGSPAWMSGAMEQEEHCVIYAEPAPPGSSVSPITWRGCYATFAEAIAVATNGGQLPPPTSSDGAPTEAQGSSSSVLSEGAVVPTALDQGQHCVVHAEPAPTGSSTSPITWRGCYATFAEAITVATDGHVHLPLSASPDDLSDDILRSRSASDTDAAQSSFVLTIEYDDTNYRGASLVTTGSMPCSSDGSAYLFPSLGAWDNRIESVRLYSNCNRAYHYENENYGGNYGDYRSDTPDMTSMRNQTSSLKICQSCLAR
jgi:hypothetical protein